MRYASTTLPGEASSVPTARRFVESLLLGWDHQELAWTAALVVSELATNAALHARTSFTLTVAESGSTVRIEVHDGAAARPQPRRYADTATTGRGLRLLDELAAEWGVTPMGDGGKAVWAMLRPEDDRGVDEEHEPAQAVGPQVDLVLLPGVRPGGTTARVAA